MFRLNEETAKEFQNETPNKYQLAKIKRQKVYNYITNHSEACECKQLAEAAGYDMSDCYSDEYKAGAAFVSNMIRNGYIEKVIHNDGVYFYPTNKEQVEIDSPVDEVSKILEEEIDKYEEEQMGPEGQSKEDWATDDPIDDFPGAREFTKRYSGAIEIDTGDKNSNVIVTFEDKSPNELEELVNKITKGELI